MAVGIIASEYSKPEDFLRDLLEPAKESGLKNENALIRYFSVEYVVNLILIIRENTFCDMVSFFEILLEVTYDVNISLYEISTRRYVTQP